MDMPREMALYRKYLPKLNLLPAVEDGRSRCTPSPATYGELAVAACLLLSENADFRATGRA